MAFDKAEHNKEYYGENREKIRKQQMEYHLLNKEKINNYNRLRYHDNREENVLKAKIYRMDNSEEIKESRRIRYIKNKDKWLTASKKSGDIRFKINRKWFEDYKKTLTCTHCNENSHECIEFHHINRETKDYNISGMMRMSREKFVEELSKCVVLCANCHRKVHAKLRRGEDVVFFSNNNSIEVTATQWGPM